MIALIQRVGEARVDIGGETVGAIGRGVLALIAVEPGENKESTQRIADRLLGYRIFPDAAGKMNLSVCDVGGGLLLVPQFTLAADTTKGMRPSFSSAASPEEGRRWFEFLVGICRGRHARVESGVFGADMKVALVNDGPVTFWLRVPPHA